MSKYIKIENEQDLVKDSDTGAILNTNLDSLSAYKAKRKKDAEMQNRVDKMENDIGDIKSMLKELINKG
jgi:tetrahydromethanopterin S-methyltransferase subunit B|tara:strand:+ start:286 stop:492 length:207 start_codon:yes stop_codon:yes gene_type:complete